MNERVIKHRGLELNISGWAEELGLTRQAVSKRLRTLPVEQALVASRAERERLWRRNLRRAGAERRDGT